MELENKATDNTLFGNIIQNVTEDIKKSITNSSTSCNSKTQRLEQQLVTDFNINQHNLNTTTITSSASPTTPISGYKWVPTSGGNWSSSGTITIQDGGNDAKVATKEEIIEWLKETLAWPEKVELFKGVLFRSLEGLSYEDREKLLEALDLRPSDLVEIIRKMPIHITDELTSLLGLDVIHTEVYTLRTELLTLQQEIESLKRNQIMSE